ncbi:MULTISPECIES: hypothetical protein [unclassified Variovorax]|uniref:hypothetical protein n=1 Tax=unclassified Variovorax TaxID=663243 RepID=UPI00076D05DD|nr:MULTISPECIES: hypothetical protein [unclassified Variovorax]KWT95537.1 hypothetical protein APY03_2414 [Variovorax sp. WDL1]PNG50140.1 hypothetical protein CHC06_05763 [Variovorax sp. B2]PNG51013.1 hypothetical protein CHC07_05669 [Variovorax sp. B4]VTV17180.1 hypothetical protein WDL1P1_00179 [Variovorax sp. WDL1]
MPTHFLAYHATVAREDFLRFELSDDVGYHFGSKDTANRRLEHLLQGGDEDDVEGARILPCLLTMQNPLRMPDCHTWTLNNLIPALRDAGVISAEQSDALWDEGYLDQAGFQALLEGAGYDAVIYRNETEGGGDSYLMLDADRIEFALTKAPETNR